MRKNIGIVVIGLSGFLLLVGLLTVAWAPGKLEKTPLDVDSVTRLEGTVAKVDSTTGELSESQPVKATSITKTDSNASDDEVAVWTSTSCVVIDEDDPADCLEGTDPRLVTASTEVFATDRVTGLAVDGDRYLPAGASSGEGLRNKWPFDAEKRTYPYWDGTLGAAVEAVYDREETLDGVETYVYTVDIVDADAEISEGLQGTYSSAKEIFVEPVTGSILNQTDDQQRYLADGTQVLDLQLAFTEDQIASGAADAQDNIAGLNLITRTVPMIGFIGGAVLLLLGLFLATRGGTPPAARARTTRREPVGAK